MTVEPPPPPAARQGCSPGCQTVTVGCFGMVLGSLLTITAELAALAYGVGFVTEALSRAGYTASFSPSTTTTEEGYVVIDKEVDRVTLLRAKCGTDAEKTDTEVAEVCREWRAELERQRQVP